MTPAKEDERRPFGPGAALLLLLVYFAADAVVLLIGDSLSDEAVGIVFFAAAAVLAPLVALYVGLVRHAPDEPTAGALRLSRPRGRTWLLIGVAVLVGAALAPLVVVATRRLLELLPKEDVPDEAAAAWVAALQLPANRLVLLVAEIGLIPFVREAFLRGLVQPRLAAVTGARRAITLVVLLDLVTLPFPELFPQALLASVPFALLALASRSTWVPLAGHVALVLAPAGLEELGLAQPSPLLVVGSTACAAAFLALGWRMRVREG